MKTVAIHQPYLGDRTHIPVGRNNKLRKVIWCACIQCGHERWVDDKDGKPKYELCKRCGKLKRAEWYLKEKHCNWKGGRIEKGSGYVGIRLYPQDHYYSMTTRMGYVLEHRLVMAEHLGRILSSSEFVHHKNGIKTDNRIENLILLDKHTHKTDYGKAFSDGYTIGYKKGFDDALKGVQTDA